MAYWTASRGEPTQCAVDPYHLASVDGQWCLIGHCHWRNDVKVFRVARIQHLELTERTFELPAGFNVEDYLLHAFSIIRGDGELHQIRLRFRAEAVRYIRERTWHPSQTLAETPDGGLIVSMTLSHLREVVRWALSWTPTARSWNRPSCAAAWSPH
jgi:predicted DNA-binding transcriptional regulator YafY